MQSQAYNEETNDAFETGVGGRFKTTLNFKKEKRARPSELGSTLSASIHAYCSVMQETLLVRPGVAPNLTICSEDFFLEL